MKEKDPGKVSQIFAATLELAGEVGLTGLKMADIAKRAGLASGTLYLYFASKEDLLNALYRELKTSHTFLSEADPQDLQLPLRLKLRRMWELSLQHGLANYRESVFMEQFAVSPFISDETRNVTSRVMRYLFDLLDEGKRQTLIKPLDNSLLLCLMSGFIKETVALCLRTDQPMTPELVETTFTLCWDAIKA